MMNVGAPVILQPTVAAAAMPFLRASVNAVRSGGAAASFIIAAKVGNATTSGDA